MKITVVTILLFTCLSLHAQQLKTGPDSLVQLPTDTLNFPQARLDSLQNGFQSKADSIAGLQQAALSKLNARKASLTHSIDSLNKLNLPTDKYLQKKDSVQQEIANTVKKYEAKLFEVKSDYTSRINSLDLPPKASAQVEKLTRSIEGFQMPSADIPNVGGNLPSMNLPDVNVPDVNLNAGQLGDVKLPDTNLPSVEGVTNVQQQVKDAVPGTEQLNDLKEVAAVKNVDGATKLAEEKVAEQVPEISAQSAELTQLQSMTSEEGAKQMVQQQAMDQIPQSPINHFAGKEEVLQKAMEDLSKLKKKYHSINSLADIKKKRPNEMHGKPFIERLKPGIGLQIFGGDDAVIVDFNPYVGYRLTGRLTSGLGWNQRVIYDTEEYEFTTGSSIYGPRVYTEYNLWRGFHPRLEVETMNTEIPPVTAPTQTDTHHREWVWAMMIGLKKEYKISSGVNGTAMVMFNLFDPHDKSPYNDVVNMRIGVEFKLKKKVKKQEKTN